MRKKYFLSLLILIFSISSSCSGVRVIAQDKKEKTESEALELYSQSFKTKMAPIKDLFKQGKLESAKKEILAFPDEGLKSVEIATKKNLLGVIYFAKKNYDESIKTFENALSLGADDPYLLAQLNLNLGSSYFKQSKLDKAYSTLSNCDFKYLPDHEAKKYHQLNAAIAQQLGKTEVSLSSKIRALIDKKTISELRSDPKYISVEDEFSKLSRSERVRMIEDLLGERSLVLGYLTYREAEKSLNLGNESDFKDSITWINEHFSGFSEITDLANILKARGLAKEEKIDSHLIGISLPLTGDKSQLAERALSGIDIMLEELNQENPENPKFKLEIKDSQSGAATGALAVKELIEVNKVALIIGGLNPQTATKEYLQARKFGVPFISLSQVYLPKEEKDHLLLEIPGSIESQVDHLFRSQLSNKLGSKGALLFPRTELGEAYANEFWRKSKQLNYPITTVMSFDRNATDFKDPIMNMLGIKFQEEREDELKLVSDISHLERNKSIKRLQSLQPQLDFNWVFAPGLPRDVLQLLPNFNFFDAFNMNFVGVPSWRSEVMQNEGYRFGNVYFVDEPNVPSETKFTQAFLSKYKKQPKFVEMIGYDSLKLSAMIIDSGSKIENREQLNKRLIEAQKLLGETGHWALQEGVWLKQMATFRLKREGIEIVE